MNLKKYKYFYLCITIILIILLVVTVKYIFKKKNKKSASIKSPDYSEKIDDKLENQTRKLNKTKMNKQKDKITDGEKNEDSEFYVEYIENYRDNSVKDEAIKRDILGSSKKKSGKTKNVKEKEVENHTIFPGYFKDEDYMNDEANFASYYANLVYETAKIRLANFQKSKHYESAKSYYKSIKDHDTVTKVAKYVQSNKALTIAATAATVLLASKGKKQTNKKLTITLKNDDVVEGILVSIDTYLNFKLKEARYFSANNSISEFDLCVIRGSSVKYSSLMVNDQMLNNLTQASRYRFINENVYNHSKSL